MAQRFRTTIGPLAVLLAVAAVVAGCGEGPAIREGSKVVARVVASQADDAARVAPRVGQRLQPTRAVARGAEVTTTRVASRMEVQMYRGFCQGWSLAREYDTLPNRTDWYGIAADYMRRWATPRLLEQVVSAYETTVYALETGNLTVGQVDLYCQFA